MAHPVHHAESREITGKSMIGSTPRKHTGHSRSTERSVITVLEYSRHDHFPEMRS